MLLAAAALAASRAARSPSRSPTRVPHATAYLRSLRLSGGVATSITAEERVDRVLRDSPGVRPVTSDASAHGSGAAAAGEPEGADHRDAAQLAAGPDVNGSINSDDMRPAVGVAHQPTTSRRSGPRDRRRVDAGASVNAGQRLRRLGDLLDSTRAHAAAELTATLQHMQQRRLDVIHNPAA